MRRTQAAIKACAEWLVYCLRVGWKRTDLDELERLWWLHHDARGRLK